MLKTAELTVKETIFRLDLFVHKKILALPVDSDYTRALRFFSYRKKSRP